MRFTSILMTLLLVAAGAAAQQQLRIGNPAPEFTAQSLEGGVFDSKQLQGKVVVMTFWSTRCAVCHSEIPKLNQLVERYRGKDVVFLALTMENNVRIEPYLQKNPFTFNIIPNSFGVLLKFADMDAGGRVNMGYPAHFLISRSGKIAHRTYGFDKASNIDAHIQKILASE
ncbi:MAG TPA: hypothetical protein DEP46_03530 [Blastocatellia bacterium]|nr:hypothetical protein [Blastocatellia bacterium]